MSQTTLWIILAGTLLVVELTTGTFYLMLLALGAGLGAVLSWAGLGIEVQIAVASLFAAGSSFLLKRKRGDSQQAAEQSDKLDIGNTVFVAQWGGPGEVPGQTRVQYRGASWTAVSLNNPPQVGTHQIVNVNGNRLELRAIPTQP